MAILFNKPIKAQQSVKTTPIYSAVSSFDAGDLPKKEDLYWQALASKVRGQQQSENTQGIYQNVLNTETPKEGAYNTIVPGQFNKGSKYQFSFLGKGDVKMGTAGRDTIFNLDDGLVHRLNYTPDKTGSLPVSYSSTDGKKNKVNTMSYFMGKVPTYQSGGKPKKDNIVKNGKNYGITTGGSYSVTSTGKYNTGKDNAKSTPVISEASRNKLKEMAAKDKLNKKADSTSKKK